MAQNTTPIFVKTPHIGFVQVSASAVVDATGVDANTKVLYTADATNGSKVEKITVTNVATNVATVVRFWVNNGSSAGTATNNIMVHEETLPGITLSQVAQNASVTWYPDLTLPAGYRILVACGTAASGAAPHVTAYGGDYT